MIKQGALRGGADNADSEVEKKAEKKRQTRLSRSYRFSCVSVFGLVHWKEATDQTLSLLQVMCVKKDLIVSKET